MYVAHVMLLHVLHDVMTYTHVMSAAWAACDVMILHVLTQHVDMFHASQAGTEESKILILHLPEEMHLDAPSIDTDPCDRYRSMLVDMNARTKELLERDALDDTPVREQKESEAETPTATKTATTGEMHVMTRAKEATPRYESKTRDHERTFTAPSSRTRVTKAPLRPLLNER